MSPIKPPFIPKVDDMAVRRNAAHWPQAVENFMAVGYGGEKYRKAEEHKRGGGDEHAPPNVCYALAKRWCDEIDAHISAYFLLPAGSFRDSALDKSAKALPKKGGAE
jgi:hypothetical protein